MTGSYLEETIAVAIRFLDNVIEVNNYIIEEIKKMTKGNRKIGLGVMGWAELLILLEIPYDSDEAVYLAEKLMRFIRQNHSKILWRWPKTGRISQLGKKHLLS